MMNRRDFVRRLVAGLAGTAVAAEMDLERLLWVPKPMIVVPELPGGLHTFASIDWVTRECLRRLEQQLSFANVVDRHYTLDAASKVGDGLITQGACTWGDESHENIQQHGIEKGFLEPAAEMLAHHVKQAHREVTTFGVPAMLPMNVAEQCAVVVNHKMGTAMRGTRYFNIVTGREELRFDVLTGGKK